MMGISLVVPMYRSSPFLDELFGRIQRLSPAPQEIIFLDDASPDDGFAMATEFAKRATLSVRIVRHATNGGIAAAYNRLAAEASCEWVHILDADDYPVENDFYARLSNELNERTDVVITGVESHSKAIAWGNRLFARFVPNHPPRWWPLLGSFATRSGAIYRRRSVLNTPFIDPAFPGSDVIHLLKLRASSRVAYVRDAHVHYRIHRDATSSAPRSYTTFLQQLGQFDLMTRLMHRLDLALRMIGQRWSRP